MTVVKRSIIVVGAGLAGLTAAYRRQKAGLAVTVLERADHPGGRVKTLRRDGFIIDAGPDAMTSGYKEYLDLVSELGMADHVVPSSRFVGIVRHGKVIDIDLGSTVSALFTRALSWPAKFHMAWGMFRLRKMFAGIDSFRLSESAVLDDENETAQQFGTRHFGRQATDYVIDPLMRLTVGSGAAQCSRLGVLAGLVSWSAQLVNIKTGLDALPNALAGQMNVIYGADVELVERTLDGGVRVNFRRGEGAPESLQADMAVIAATYDVTARIYPGLANYAGDYEDKLKYVRLISVSLAYGKETNSKAYAVQVPTCENADVLLIFLQHNKAPDRAPNGSSLVTLYTDTLATPRILHQSDQEIATWARTQIETLMPELRGHIKFVTVSRWPVAGYLATPGFWRRTAKLQAALPASSPIQIAGDLFGAGSMESAIRGGNRAAKNITDHLQI
jgi:protoporphyrinogen oxidase